jgi:hypothetical protein
MRRAVATIKFTYDPDTYLYDWREDEKITDEEIIDRVRTMMLEDINTTDNDGDLHKFIEVEFVEIDDPEPEPDYDGIDDSAYRRDMKDAGRGHLLR